MEIDKPISLSSSSGYDDRYRDPKDYIDQSVAEVSFGFNHLRLDTNGRSDSQQLMPESAATEDEDQEEDDDNVEEQEEEGEFTFMCTGDDGSPNSAVFEDGQIRPVFPLFDQTLLLGGDYDGEGRYRLPVDKVFIESPHRSPSSSASGHEETDGVSEGLYFVSSKESDTGTPELNKKSNSTGFSKLWRFKDKVSRSYSDGRDAFVFLNSSDKTTTTSSSTASTTLAKAEAVERSPSKINASGGGKAKVVKKGSKAKRASAHEVYLKKRGEQTEERRRSYLPYRPGVMGFFTTVNGGLSRNVHPF